MAHGCGLLSVAPRWDEAHAAACTEPPTDETTAGAAGRWVSSPCSLESRAHVNVTASPSAPVVAHGISRAHRLQQRPCRRVGAHQSTPRSTLAARMKQLTATDAQKYFHEQDLKLFRRRRSSSKKMRLWSLGGAVHERKEKPKLSVELTMKSKMAASRLIKQRANEAGSRGHQHSAVSRCCACRRRCR